jgi:tRNA(fMet)-specific endonuclease VapC
MASSHPDNIVVCSIVKAELLYGVAKSNKPKRNLTRVLRFLDPFVSLPFDDSAAQVYGQIRALLEKSGALIGPNDLLIAATAIVHNATLVTHNVREFSRVKGLAIEDWEI